MKILYFELSKKIDLNEQVFLELLETLPKKIFLAYLVQYKNLAGDIKKRLKSQGIKITGFKQVLGCSRFSVKEPILLIGESRFHALNLLGFAPRVIVFDGFSFTELTEKKEQEKTKKAKFSKFLNSENIGLLVSTKAQSSLSFAKKAKKELEQKYPKKNFFIFLFDTLDMKEFENFQIDFWLNFACPGLEYDSPRILNFCSLKEFLKN